MSLSRILISYISIVRKIELAMSKDLQDDIFRDGASFLFWKENGNLNQDQVRNSITKVLSNYEIFIHFKSYRHVVKAFMRHHMRDPTENDISSQFGHSNFTSELYGKSSNENMRWEELENNSRKQSNLWHKFLKLRY